MIMSGTTDKAAGVANEVVGGAKRNIGQAVGSEKLEAEGLAQEFKGKVQKSVGDAKNAAKDAANKLAEKANENL
jgi:uncharacterized protein YjbJ (UPF0337 family)